VHVSDLSWTKKIKHPSEFTKIGDKLDVVVLELDAENRRLALGHKQLEENPWNTFETIFTPGSVHKGTILNKSDKGAVVELPYGVEGFATTKHLAKQDGKVAEAGETLEFKVLEFSKDDKKILVSHTKMHSDVAEEAKETSKKPAKPAKAPKAKPAEVEKSTLGDNEVLSALKAAGDKAEAEKKAKKSKKDSSEEEA
jgi:small subunit ribosomal protein S1